MISYEQRDPDLIPEKLSDPAYFAERLAFYRSDPAQWLWYLNYHHHGCKRCNRVWVHTGLEATRDGEASHQCCGKDVRAE